MSGNHSTSHHDMKEAVSMFPPSSQFNTESPDKSVFRLGHVGWYVHTRMNMGSLGSDSQGEETEKLLIKGEIHSTQSGVFTKRDVENEIESEDSETTTPPTPPEMPVLVKKRAPNGDTLYFCNECTYNSNFKRSVHRHIQSVHMGLRSFMCPYCEYKANYMSNIKRHVSSVHDGERRFACPRCDYRTSDKGHLSSHIKAVHDKLKPFQCNECNYHASKRTDLNIHVKTVHEKEKPHQCPYCTYQASKSGNLKRHVKNIHEDPPPPKRKKRNISQTVPEQNSFTGDFLKSEVVKSILGQVSEQESTEQMYVHESDQENPPYHSPQDNILNMTNKIDNSSCSNHKLVKDSLIPLVSDSKNVESNSLKDVIANREVEILVVPKSH